MNLQLPLVVSDITGVTGLRILRDIVAGHRDPQRLAEHRDYRCRASISEIVAALTGNYRPEHVFALQQNLELFDRTLKGQLVYQDPGADAYDLQQRSRTLRHLRHRAATLGFELVNRETGEILPAGVS